MKKNFNFEQNIGIQKGDLFIDLHNFYFLSDISYSMSDDVFEIFFNRNKHSSKNISMPNEVYFKFTGIKHISFSKNILTKKNVGLEEVGYKNADDFNLDWLIRDKNSNEKDHIIFRFDDDEFVRIGCDFAKFKS